MFGLPKEAIGAILAALVTGVVALIGLIISKEQKVSEFRQQWIDALRVDVAKAISCAHSTTFVRIMSKIKEEDVYTNDFFESFEELMETAARIRLRLNEKEETSQALLKALNRVVKLSKESEPTHGEMSTASDELVATTQIVLKREWDRVRSGEFVYRIAKYSAAILTIFLISCIVIYAVEHLRHS